MKKLLNTVLLKIIRTASIFVLFSLMTSIVSLIFIIRVSDEIENLTEQDLPLMENIILVTEYQLEQTIHFERTLRFGEIMEKKPNLVKLFDREIGTFNKISQLIDIQMRKTKQQIARHLKNQPPEKIMQKFNNIKQTIEEIEQEHSHFEYEAHKIFVILATEGMSDSVETMMERVEGEQDLLNKKVEVLLQKIEKHTYDSALVAKKHEAVAIIILSFLFLVNLIMLIISVLYVRKMMQKTMPDMISKIEYLANYDSLTSLLNRQAFLSKANIFFNLAKRDKKVFSILAIDLDFFKTVNDNYGHSGGDEVLKSFAKTSLAVLRESDLLGRIGGEEFVVLLPHIDTDEALPLVNRLHSAIRSSKINYEETIINYTVSIGLTSFAVDKTKNIEALLKQADQALYFAKENGRNCSAIFKTKTDFSLIK